MKKIEKYIYVVIALIIGAVLASTVTYIVMDKKYDNHNNNEQNENNSNNEQISLSDEELHEYLSYIPTRNIKGMSLYEKKYTNVKTISEVELIEQVLSNSLCWDNNSCPFDTSIKEMPIDNFSYPATVYFPLTYIKSELLKMYNYDLKSIKDGVSIKDSYDANGLGYIYQNGYFKCTGGGDNSGNHINYIEKYDISNESLIIYEYAAYYDYFRTENFYDYYTDYYHYISIEETKSYSSYLDYLANYLKNNKNDFTQYKHTFKNNDTGYYWYSTEVIER
ncbi:MAG: hypothetical protein E7163_05415 [Firmicutes bacterium]|nr:hypothetical protein [Bacillota bacterium]